MMSPRSSLHAGSPEVTSILEFSRELMTIQIQNMEGEVVNNYAEHSTDFNSGLICSELPDEAGYSTREISGDIWIPKFIKSPSPLVNLSVVNSLSILSDTEHLITRTFSKFLVDAVQIDPLSTLRLDVTKTVGNRVERVKHATPQLTTTDSNENQSTLRVHNIEDFQKFLAEALVTAFAQ